MKKNIVVLFGGVSSEHDISIITANQILNNLDEQKYNIIPVYISKWGSWYTGKQLFDIATFNNKELIKKLSKVSLIASSNYLYKITGLKRLKKLFKVDCVITALHGVNGEDGTIQGLLELCNIPYTSSGVVGSSVNMDKVIMKQVFKSFNLPVLPFIVVNRNDIDVISLDKQIKDSFDYPVIIKPANLGSSIGISICNNKTELKEGLEIASEFDKKMIIEKCVKELKEINCSVMGYGSIINISELEEPINWQSFLSFEDKYLGQGKSVGMETQKRIFPAKLTKKLIKEIKDMSKFVFNQLECKGVVRIDYIINKEDNKLYINEINTIPGSFAFYLWDVSFTKLLDQLIDYALLANEDKNKNKYTFSSNVINQFLQSDSNKLTK